MTRTILFCCFLLALGLVEWGCGKEENPTVEIKGKVINRKTGEPVEDAFVYCRGVSYNENGGEVPSSCSDRTDANGQFACTFTGNYGASTIDKEGYVSKFFPLNIDDKKDEVIELVPRDGFLRLRMENNTGTQSPLQVSIYNRTVAIETMQNIYYIGEVIKEYPLLISQGEIYTEIFDLPSTELVEIRWGFGQITSIDSVIINTNDTTNYILSY